MTRGENSQLKKLKEENESLKSQLDELSKEFNEVKKKLEAQATNDDLQESVNLMSADYDELKAKKSAVENDVRKIEEQLSELTQKIYDFDEAIESIMAYSYQYNIKILGIPQANVKETADETVEICLKLFKELGAKVNEQDIDIAHRLQNRDISKPAVIVCKFTRRIAKEAVMSKRKALNNVNLQNVVPHPESVDTILAIYDHLTPKKQELLKKKRSLYKENKDSPFVGSSKIPSL